MIQETTMPFAVRQNPTALRHCEWQSMTNTTTIRKTFKYRMYHNRRNKLLHQRIDIAGLIWNHMVALQRRYYRLTRKYADYYKMQKHLSKLRMKSNRFAHWRLVGSQAVQDLAERHDKAYQRFFDWKRGEGRRHGRPRLKKVKKYSSFTLKQAGWKYEGGNRIVIHGATYPFSLSRPVEGTIKTVTIKRDDLAQLWVCFSVVTELPVVEASAGKIGGFDFGLKAFLTDHTGKEYHSPQFLKSELDEIARLNRELVRKQRGSNNRRKAKWRLAKAHQRIANKRRDAHWRLAHKLCAEFDLICLETLNIDGIKRMWGRKVSDLGFAEFVGILHQAAEKMGIEIVQVDQWLPTSKACASCGNLQEMPLSERHFNCLDCGWSCNRDQNAALNIFAAGASAAGLGDVRREQVRAVSA
jgi:putative transposase